MKVRPLLLDEKNKAEIKRIVDYAHGNHFTMNDMLDVINKQLPMAGDMGEYTCYIDFGYRVVFSIEEQVVGNVYHLSISVDEDGKLPNVEVVKEIIQEVGFNNKIGGCMVKLEDISPERQAVNVLEIHN